MDGGGQRAILWRQERGGGRMRSPRCAGEPWENQGKTMGKPWENHGKTMGKPWENHGKTMGNHGKPWENGDLTKGKWENL